MPRRADHAAAAASVPPAPPRGAPTGQQHRIDIDQRAGTVTRTPLRERGRANLEAAAARLDAAQRAGLPAPRLLDVAGGVMTTELLPGTPLRDAGLGADELQRLVRDVAAVLVELREFPDRGWPDPRRWEETWVGTQQRVRSRVLPLLDDDPATRTRTIWDTAVECAADARGLQHGDLSAGNVLVDPRTGALTGIIDWDDAILGDTGLDVVAAAHTLGPAAADALLTAEPSLRDELRRGLAYIATWPSQQVLWGLENDDPEVTADGLARMTGTPSDGRRTVGA